MKPATIRTLIARIQGLRDDFNQEIAKMTQLQGEVRGQEEVLLRLMMGIEAASQEVRELLGRRKP